jgi:hypothetical protein
MAFVNIDHPGKLLGVGLNSSRDNAIATPLQLFHKTALSNSTATVYQRHCASKTRKGMIRRCTTLLQRCTSAIVHPELGRDLSGIV